MTTTTTESGTAARVLEQWRPRATKLAAALQELLVEEEKLVAAIAEADAAELDANRASWSEGRSAYEQIDSPAHRARKRRDNAEKKLAQLRRFELPAAREASAQAERELAIREVAAAREGSRAFDAAEAEAFAEAADAIGAFFSAWDAFASALEGREALLASLEDSGVLASLDDNERANLARDFAAVTASSVPQNALVLAELFVRAAVEEHAAGEPLLAAAAALAAPFREQARRKVTLRQTDVRLSFGGPALEVL